MVVNLNGTAILLKPKTYAVNFGIKLAIKILNKITKNNRYGHIVTQLTHQTFSVKITQICQKPKDLSIYTIFEGIDTWTLISRC